MSCDTKIDDRPEPAPETLRALRLAETDGYVLELHCCGRRVDYPCRLLARQHDPDVLLGAALERLRCTSCGKPPAAITLHENNLVDGKGYPYGWQVVLKP